MNRFYPAAGQFWLNDQAQLIQAGEFHYFRTPPDQWHHRMDLLKGAGFNTLATYIPWLWHQVEEDVSDFDGHSHPMRNLEGFLDLAADMGFFIIPRPGPYIMAETINEGIPPWVFSNYPQVAFISQDKKAQNIVSYMHPDFMACVRKWYQAIFSVLTPRQITRDGNVIMIQLDNEMGMMHWVRNIMDVNPHTIGKLAAYLRQTYGEQLQDRYPTEALKTFLSEGISDPQPPYGELIVEDYRRFFRGYLHEYATFLLEEARANGMDTLPVINIHGFANGGKTFPIGLSQLIDVMDMEGMISATDVYPGHISEGDFHQLLLVNEMTKALHHKDQALFSIEFQSGGMLDFSGRQSSLYDLHTRLCVSSGMRAINHYLFFGGENDPILSPIRRHDWGPPVRTDGTLRKHYYRYPKLSKVLKTYGSDLILSTPKAVTTIGFLLDYFMTEVNNETSRQATREITHQRERVLFDLIARGLALTHRPFNTIEISRDELDPTRSPTLWVLMDRRCDGYAQDKLVNYIKNGGKLVLIGRMCVEEFDHSECTTLKDALGIEQIQGGEPFKDACIQVFDYLEVPVSFVETYEGDFEHVFAETSIGDTVGFTRKLGQGEVLVFGASLDAHTLADLDIVDRMALWMDVQPVFRLSDWTDVRISEGENGSFVFINNYQDDPVETTVEYQRVMLFGEHVIQLPARRGLILPLEWRVNEALIVHYATSEVLEIRNEGSSIVLDLVQEEFFAEVTLKGYHPDRSVRAKKTKVKDRLSLHGKKGKIVLVRDD